MTNHDPLRDASTAAIAAAQAVADARQLNATIRNGELRAELAVAHEALGVVQRAIHEARGERRDLLVQIAKLTADAEYWRGVSARRFAS